MNARDIIRDGIIKETGFSLATVRADAAIAALTAAGYRIVPPGGLDRETLERAATLADAYADSEDVQATEGLAACKGVGSPGWVKDALHSNGVDVASKIAAAIRSLAAEDRT